MLALVVDDSRAMRAMIRRYLDDLGFDVVEAADGQEGLDKLDESRANGAEPTVMLVD